MAFRTDNRHSLRFTARKRWRVFRQRLADDLRRLTDHIDPQKGRMA